MNKLLVASLTAVSITSFYISPISAQSQTPECENAIASVEDRLTSDRANNLFVSILDRPKGRPLPDVEGSDTTKIWFQSSIAPKDDRYFGLMRITPIMTS